MIDVKGKTIVLAGRFELTQGEIRDKLEGLGARYGDKPSDRTDLLFAASRAGAKLAEGGFRRVPDAHTIAYVGCGNVQRAASGSKAGSKAGSRHGSGSVMPASVPVSVPASRPASAPVLSEPFSDLKMKYSQIVIQGDQAAYVWTLTGTNDSPYNGPFGTLEPTGEEIVLLGGLNSRLENGKIVEEWVHLDRLQLLEKLGGIDIGTLAEQVDTVDSRQAGEERGDGGEEPRPSM